MKSIKETAALPIEELSRTILCATKVEPKDDGFVATFQLRNCSSIPQLGVSKSPRLLWYSPSKYISSCNRSGCNLYGSAHIAKAISKTGLGDYTAILGKFMVLHEDGKDEGGDILFETTDPREAEYVLLLPIAASEWSSNSYEEAEVQRHSLMYAVNDDTRWGSKRYILLGIGYRYTKKDETLDYAAQANLVRRLAVAELILTGHCPEDLANEFFPGLTRDKVVGGCLLTKAFGERKVGSGATRTCYVIDAHGDTIPATTYRDYYNGELELLWFDIPDNALVIYCDYDPTNDRLEVTPIQGKMNSANKEQRGAAVNIVNDWLTE